MLRVYPSQPHRQSRLSDLIYRRLQNCLHLPVDRNDVHGLPHAKQGLVAILRPRELLRRMHCLRLKTPSRVIESRQPRRQHTGLCSLLRHPALPAHHRHRHLLSSNPPYHLFSHNIRAISIHPSSRLKLLLPLGVKVQKLFWPDEVPG